MRCPIVINCRDRLSSLIPLVEWLEQVGQDEIYLLDNDSSYEPLLKYYETTPHRVIRLGENLGHQALWLTNALKDRFLNAEHYVYTDPDVVPIRECPPDAVDLFLELLERYPECHKVGFGLRIDDIPDHYVFKREVLKWEAQFWKQPVAPGLFYAPIDTTFALYRAQGGHDLNKAIRTGYPLARHLSWYSNTAKLSEEELYYRQHAAQGTAHWALEKLPHYLTEKIEALSVSEESWSSVRPCAELLTSAWLEEPGSHDEAAHTPWAERGWSAWNGMSPEVEFCEFAASLARLLAPRVVVETGTGQGFITRRVAVALGDEQTLICFESDSATRDLLRQLPFFQHPNRQVADAPRPTPVHFGRADLSILDSDFSERSAELQLWWDSARVGAAVLVHDCGNGHDRDTGHAQLRSSIEDLGVPGLFLRNPRGSFLGFKPPSDGSPRADVLDTLLREKCALEVELAAWKSSRSFRYTKPLRRLRSMRRSLRLERFLEAAKVKWGSSDLSGE